MTTPCPQRARPVRRIGAHGQAALAGALLVLMTLLLLPPRSFLFWLPQLHDVDATDPAAGYEQATPEVVRDAIVLLRAQRLRTFDVGPWLRNNPLYYQRLLAAALPARAEDGAADLLVHRDRLDAGRCVPLARRGVLVHARCTP